MTIDPRGPTGRQGPRGSDVALGLALVVQAACAAFFLYDILGAIFGLRSQPISWRLRELSEISATLGLILGAAVTAVALRRSDRRRRDAEDRLAAVSSAFADLVETRFDQWALTPAERDVAFFLMKGFSTAEIAGLRETSEGTVKAQTAAVYRKAQVSSRAQLLGHFIDDLFDDQLVTEAQSPD